MALPGNPRYQPKELRHIFGYDFLMAPVGRVEIASLLTLGEIGVIPEHEIALLTPGVEQQVLSILTTEVDRLERSGINHDIRAWIAAAKAVSPEALHRWWHVLLTSYDPLATARILQFTRAQKEVVDPLSRGVIYLMANLVEKYSAELQIGRTHGQHALPITVGFWLATILQRWLYNAQEMREKADRLVGKISGAVGACNAQVGLGIADRCGDYSFEARVLDKLGLKPAVISTQILPPEPLAYYLHACLMQSLALAQFGRDGRHLMRSEIGELMEPDDAQGSSSTMAHKVNPINFENLEGMAIKNMAEHHKVEMIMISEHQRDLVGSSVARDFPIMVVNLVQQLNTLLRRNKQGVPFLSRLQVSRQALERNFAMSQDVILAEPLYIALQMAGYEGSAYDLVNKALMPLAKARGVSLIQVAEERAHDDEHLAHILGHIPDRVMSMLHSPREYTGRAPEEALKIVDLARDFNREFRPADVL